MEAGKMCLESFFFQAEDGIRDYKVTGVQTCALPISGAPFTYRGGDRPSFAWVEVENWASTWELKVAAVAQRSEERRVGKEGRARGRRDHVKKRDRGRGRHREMSRSRMCRRRRGSSRW